MKLLTTTEIKKVSGAAGGFYGSVSWQCALSAGMLVASAWGGPLTIASAAVGAMTACLK